MLWRYLGVLATTWPTVIHCGALDSSSTSKVWLSLGTLRSFHDFPPTHLSGGEMERWAVAMFLTLPQHPVVTSPFCRPLLPCWLCPAVLHALTAWKFPEAAPHP